MMIEPIQSTELKEFLDKNNISIPTLAERMNLSKSTVYRYVKGEIPTTVVFTLALEAVKHRVENPLEYTSKWK